MRLPDSSLEYEGRRIAVTKLQSCGDYEQTMRTALYRDRKGAFYIVYLNARRGIREVEAEVIRERGICGQAEQVSYPRDLKRLDAMQQITERTIRVSDRGALLWYLREFMDAGPLKDLMGEAFAAYVPKEERAGKAQLTAWTDRATVRQLERTAKAAGVTAPEQLRLFAEEGIRQAQSGKSAAKRGKAAGGPPKAAPVQLQLATALVEVVDTLEKRPTYKALSEAQRAVSRLHQSLHSPEAFKRATA